MKSNESTSWLYDPKYTYTTTINGQLMLTMLAEKLMNIPDSTLIQINTDGLTLKLKKEYESMYYDICKEWESITKLQLEYAYYSKMMIRDVNSYIAVYTNGKTKCKGAYEIENIPLHKNKSSLIERIAIYNWFLYNTPIEKTIKEHTNIFDFCFGIRVRQGAKLYEYDKNANKKPLHKTIRYIISNKGTVFKKLYDDGRSEYLNAPSIKGKAWYQTLLNNIVDTNALNYDLNYNFYIKNVKEELSLFDKKPTLF